MSCYTAKTSISRFITTLFILIMSALFAGVAYGANCGGAIACNCGDTLNESRTLNASDTLTGCGADGIVISASNIVLDCNGTIISGSNTESGIKSYTYNNVTIKNCILQNFAVGINLQNAASINVTNNTAYTTYVPGTGIYLMNINNASVTGNTILNNSIGVEIYTSNYSMINNNRIYNNTQHDLRHNSGSSNNATLNYWGGYICVAKLTGLTKETVTPYYIDSAMTTLHYGPDTCCGDAISSSMTLNNNLTGCTGNGLNITASNVVLDCDGNTISGDNAGTEYGVQVSSGLTNVTVRNCRISEFTGTSAAGIYSASSGVLESNILTHNFWGIYTSGGFVGVIRSNIITNSTRDGLYEGTTNLNNITNNTITNSAQFGLNLGNFNAKVWHNNIYNNTQYNFFSGTPGLEISYQQEGNYWGRTSCPAFIAGNDTFRPTNVDSYPYRTENGWVGGSPADCIAPTVIIISPTSGPYYTSTVNLEVVSDEPIDTWEYSLNGAANVTFTPNTTVTGVEGTNTIYVYGNDTSGNRGPASIYQSIFYIDTSGPTITVSSPTATTYTSTSVQLNVSADKPIHTWEYSLNGAANATFTPNTTITAAEGANTLAVYANDTGGSRGAGSSAVINFSVDTTPPTISNVVSSPSSSGATITWNTDENSNSKVDYGTNTSVLGSTSSSATYTTNNSVTLSGLSASTTYYYNVTSCDQIGHCKTEGTYTFNTSAAPTGGSGGGGGGSRGYSSQYTVGNMTGGSGEWNLNREDSVVFSHQAEEHTITVVRIGRNYGVFQVSSTPKEFTLYTGQSQEVDLDDDGDKDISVKLMEVFYSKVLIKVTSLVSKESKIDLLPPREPRQMPVFEEEEAEMEEYRATLAQEPEPAQENIINSQPPASETEEKEPSGKGTVLGIVIVAALLAMVIGMTMRLVKKKQ